MRWCKTAFHARMPRQPIFNRVTLPIITLDLPVTVPAVALAVVVKAAPIAMPSVKLCIQSTTTFK